jgi:hypothetical protein
MLPTVAIGHCEQQDARHKREGPHLLININQPQHSYVPLDVCTYIGSPVVGIPVALQNHPINKSLSRQDLQPTVTVIRPSPNYTIQEEPDPERCEIRCQCLAPDATPQARGRQLEGIQVGGEIRALSYDRSPSSNNLYCILEAEPSERSQTVNSKRQT